MVAQIFEPDANEERARTSTLKYQGAPAYIEAAAVPHPTRLYTYMYLCSCIYTYVYGYIALKYQGAPAYIETAAVPNPIRAPARYANGV